MWRHFQLLRQKRLRPPLKLTRKTEAREANNSKLWAVASTIILFLYAKCSAYEIIQWRSCDINRMAKFVVYLQYQFCITHFIEKSAHWCLILERPRWYKSYLINHCVATHLAAEAGDFSLPIDALKCRSPYILLIFGVYKENSLYFEHF